MVEEVARQLAKRHMAGESSASMEDIEAHAANNWHLHLEDAKNLDTWKVEY